MFDMQFMSRMSALIEIARSIHAVKEIYREAFLGWTSSKEKKDTQLKSFT